MATPEAMQRLMVGGKITDEDLPTFILAQPNHITTKFVTKGKEPPRFPSGGFSLITKFKDFYGRLTEDNVRFLKETNMFFEPNKATAYINWSLLRACTERWNPQTHTFFFKYGEMTISVEEAEDSLPLRGAKDTGYGLPSNLNHVPPLHSLLRRISGDGAIIKELIKEDELNLSRLWEFIKPILASDKRASNFGVLLIMAGIVLFPQANGMMQRNHIALIEQHAYHQQMSLSHPVLAHLLTGLDSASTGGDFFGSPYLFNIWAEKHFCFSGITKVVRSEEGSVAHRTPQKGSLPWFRLKFDTIQDGDIIFRLPEFRPPRVAIQERSESILIGGSSFAAYAIGRCTRQTGETCRVPCPIGHIPRLEKRVFDYHDSRRLKDALIHWDYHTHHAPQTPPLSTEETEARLRTYCDWVRIRAPDQLHAISSQKQRQAKGEESLVRGEESLPGASKTQGGDKRRKT